jgi:penicillin-binding protein 1A
LEDFSLGMGSILLFYLPLGAFFEPCLLLKTWKPDSNLATEIISADGVVLGKYFQKTDLN